MIWPLFKRIGLSLPNIVGVVIVTFVLARLLPGDPAAYFAGPAADNAAIEAMRRSMGLDRPIHEQLWTYVGQLVHGDLGTSLVTGKPVTADILRRLPASLELAVFALVLAVVVAVPLGILAAAARGGLMDRLFRYSMTITASLPTFFVGLIFLFLFYHVLKIAPAPIGRLPIFASSPREITGFLLIDSLLAGKVATFRAAFAQILLPAISLALFAIAPIARLTRSLMIEALASDYVAAARAHGLGPMRVVMSYAFRNAFISLLNVIGMVFSFLVGATVMIEKIYGWPGIGSYAVEAVLSSDYAAVQGFVLAASTLYIVVNLSIDLISITLDPRQRGMA